MAELEVIYDPDKEFAAIVNVDDRCGWGPAMIGPHAGDVLQAFLDAVPFDVSQMGSLDAQAAFESFLSHVGALGEVETDTAGIAPQVDLGDTGVDAPAAAEHEAHAERGGPPAPQPADTDMEADASAEDQVIVCVNCEGQGMIRFGGDEPDQQCGMCHGTGKLTVSATS